MNNFILYSYKKGNFSLKGGTIAPNASLSYTTDILQNYIPLSPSYSSHYIHHTKYVWKVNKSIISVITSELDKRELTW